MPTGYTAMIEEDGNTNAREFVRRCARGFMPFIHQRDVDPLSTPPRLPDEPTPSSYRIKALEEARARVREVDSWTQARAREEYEKYVAKTTALNDESIDEFNKTEGLYQEVLGKLDQWEPDEKVSSLKEFCLQQIEMCIPKSVHVATILTFDGWLESEQKEARRSVEVYKELAEEERERYKGNLIMAQIFLDEIERVPE